MDTEHSAITEPVRRIEVFTGAGRRRTWSAEDKARIVAESVTSARDDRPWGGADPPGVAYVYAPDRKAERPVVHLAGFKGVLQVDGYAGYRALAKDGTVQLAFCWAHVRRHFYELAVGGPAPIASEALKRIAELYAVETECRGRSPDERRALRQEKSRRDCRESCV